MEGDGDVAQVLYGQKMEISPQAEPRDPVEDRGGGWRLE